MSLAYKVEELLALRDSVSESAVSIERFADEDVIKGMWAALASLLHFHFHFTPRLPRLISPFDSLLFASPLTPPPLLLHHLSWSQALS